jgi:hypothetical protein
MAKDDVRTRAAAYIDDVHKHNYDNLFEEHRRQEQRSLAQHKIQLQRYEDSRITTDDRYVQRLRSIESKHDRVADQMHKRHNSIGGKLAAMTKAGRQRQADELERLGDRARQLQARATRQYQALTERRLETEQRDRISRARELKFLRLDHLENRRDMQQRHEMNRPQQIEDRVKTLHRVAAEQSLRHELRQIDQHSRGKSLIY